MEKLLHERLRECAVFGCDAVETAKAEFEQQHDGDFIKYLADEIERCYIPRPQDKEGRPWNTGDDVLLPNGEENNIEFILCDCDGLKIGVYDGDRTAWYKGDECSRPTPKVYDADGVQCDVGDEGWNVSDGHPYEILDVYSDTANIKVTDRVRNPKLIAASYFTHERPVFDAEGVRICKGDTVWHVDTGNELVVKGLPKDDRGCLLLKPRQSGLGEPHPEWYAPHLVTRREPDSLKKLRQFAVDSADYADGCERDKFVQIAERLTAFIERGA